MTGNWISWLRFLITFTCLGLNVFLLATCTAHNKDRNEPRNCATANNATSDLMATCGNHGTSNYSRYAYQKSKHLSNDFNFPLRTQIVEISIRVLLLQLMAMLLFLLRHPHDFWNKVGRNLGILLKVAWGWDRTNVSLFQNQKLRLVTVTDI